MHIYLDFEKNIIELYFGIYLIVFFSLIIAGIMAINTNIEDTKNII
jgi:hypothetical protein